MPTSRCLEADAITLQNPGVLRSRYAVDVAADRISKEMNVRSEFFGQSKVMPFRELSSQDGPCVALEDAKVKPTRYVLLFEENGT